MATTPEGADGLPFRPPQQKGIPAHPGGDANLLGIAPGDDSAAVAAWLAEYGNPRTQAAYRLTAERALVWAALTQCSLSRITHADWVRFRSALADRPVCEAIAARITDPHLRGCFERAFLAAPRGRPQASHNPTRAARTMVILRILLNWLRDHGHVATVALPRQRGAARPREDVMRERVSARILTPEQLGCVISTLRDLRWERLEEARMLMVMVWLLMAGVRRAEVAGATTADFVRSERTLFWRVRGKGDKTREVPVTAHMWAAWERYRAAFGRPAALPAPAGAVVDPLVLPLRGYRAAGLHPQSSGGTVWLIVRAFGALAAERASTPTDAARIRAASPHWYRHQLATLLLEQGSELRDVQALLGHAAITTTATYQHVRHGRLAEMMQSLDAALLAPTDAMAVG